MLYAFLKIWVRFGATIFCRRIIVNNRRHLEADGPLLLASNHPNSFLDAIIVDILFKKPVWSLARGDVFKNTFYNRLLNKLKILPVYRTTEGVENLEVNYQTFNACKELFKNKGIVLMFSEGQCVNEWHLRPLKKGTARLAVGAWNDNIPLRVLPVGINFSSFLFFGKNVFINFGKEITYADVDMSGSDGASHSLFNNRLNEELKKLVYEINLDDRKMKERMLGVNVPSWKKITLSIPALIGFLLHLPIYYPIYWFTKMRTKGNDHFDSVITALLVFIYPFYLLSFTAILFLVWGTWWSLIALCLLPLTAVAAVELKRQF